MRSDIRNLIIKLCLLELHVVLPPGHIMFQSFVYLVHRKVKKISCLIMKNIESITYLVAIILSAVHGK